MVSVAKHIKIDSLIKADREKVWRFWTEPAHIKKWNFASDDWCCPSAENDLKEMAGKPS